LDRGLLEIGMRRILVRLASDRAIEGESEFQFQFQLMRGEV
jgi:hypothetical protein